MRGGDSGRPRGRRRARGATAGRPGGSPTGSVEEGVNGTGAWRVPEGRRGVSGGVSGGVPRHDGWCSARGNAPRPAYRTPRDARAAASSAPRRHRACRIGDVTDLPTSARRLRPIRRARPSPRARACPSETPRETASHTGFIVFPTPQPNPTPATARNPSRRPSKPRQLPKTPPRAIASSCARFACKVTDLLPSLAIATGETPPPRQRVGPSSTRSPPRPPAGNGRRSPSLGLTLDDGLHETRVVRLTLGVERVHLLAQLRLPLRVPVGERRRPRRSRRRAPTGLLGNDFWGIGSSGALGLGEGRRGGCARATEGCGWVTRGTARAALGRPRGASRARLRQTLKRADRGSGGGGGPVTHCEGGGACAGR